MLMRLCPESVHVLMCLKWENVFGLQITHSEFLTNLFNHNNMVLSGHAPVTLVIATGEDFPSLSQDRNSFPYYCIMKSLQNLWEKKKKVLFYPNGSSIGMSILYTFKTIIS